MSTNPYAAPASVPVEIVNLDSVEAVRNANLSHEASVKSIGTLYILGAIIMLPLSLFMIIAAVQSVPTSSPEQVVTAFAAIIYFAIGVLQLATGIGLRRLQSWARWVAVVLSAIGLLAIPIGTLISGYFLYLLVSQKGTVVFSASYREVIDATPHIKYRTSKIVIALLIVLLIVIAFGITAALVRF